MLEVMEFLVGEGFDRSGIEDAFSLIQRMIDLILSYERLPRTRFRAYQNMFIFRNGDNRMFLEWVQRKGIRMRRESRGSGREVRLNEK
jgi:hypothetical protein